MTARVALTLLLAFAFFYLSWGFITVLIMGAAIAVLLHRPYLYLEGKNVRPSLAAGLVTVGVTVCIFLPMGVLGVTGIRAGVKTFKSWRDSPFTNAPGGEAELLDKVLAIPFVDRALEQVALVFRMETAEIVEAMGGMAKTIGLKAADLFTLALSSLPAFTVQMFILLLAIFFSLLDGQKLVRFLRVNTVFPNEETEEIFSAFTGICRSVLLASLVSGAAQALIYLTGMLFAGTAHIPLYALLVFVGSFVPLVGAAPLTFGLAIFTLIDEPSKGPGIVLLIFAIIASAADNFVRPVVLRGGANLHPLIAFVALFGGLQVFGFAGLFLGPILAGLFVVTVQSLVKANGRSASMGA